MTELPEKENAAAARDAVFGLDGSEPLTEGLSGNKEETATVEYVFLSARCGTLGRWQNLAKAGVAKAGSLHESEIPMRAELRHRLVSIFPDDIVAKRPCRSMTVHTGRGTVAAVHVLCNDLPPGRLLRGRVTCGGRLVEDAQWFALVDVPVEKNTDTIFGLEKEGRRNPHVIRRAPFRIYDAMSPMPSAVTVDASTMALRLHVPVPRDARPGPRHFQIELTVADQTLMLNMHVHVHRPIVPPVGAGTFPYTNWFSYAHIADRHGLTLWSPPYWSMLRKYAALMAHGRQNSFLLPLDVLFDNLTLNTQRMKRLVKLFSDAGMHWIEGGHLAGGFRDGDFRTSLTSQAAMSTEGHATIARVLRQLKDAIDANGWSHRWLQHVVDEPKGESCTAYRVLSGIAHKYLPGVPLIDAIMDTSLVGTANVFVIQNDQVRDHLPHFQAQREFGDRVWLYTCMGPGGNALNRLMDMELMRCTLISWACMACNFDGYLHWGLNQYIADQDPLKQSCVADLPAGDTHIVYPGRGRPWSSLRLEAHREGMEDLELLRQLQRRGSKACREIVQGMVKDCWHFTKDTRVLDAARRRLLVSASHGQ